MICNIKKSLWNHYLWRQVHTCTIWAGNEETYLVMGSTSIKSVTKFERPLTTTFSNEAWTTTGGEPWENCIDSIFIGSVGGSPSLGIPVLISGLSSSRVWNMGNVSFIMEIISEWVDSDQLGSTHCCVILSDSRWNLRRVLDTTTEHSDISWYQPTTGW